MKKRIDSRSLPSPLKASLDHLTDRELLRLNPPESRLECALSSRLNHCLGERDEVLSAQAALDDLSVARDALADAVKVVGLVSVELEALKKAARAVVAHWDRGDLAAAVNDLRRVVEGI
jgi:hypothetical protein